jgi:hypothetical protein
LASSAEKLNIRTVKTIQEFLLKHLDSADIQVVNKLKDKLVGDSKLFLILALDQEELQRVGLTELEARFLVKQVFPTYQA